MRCKRKRRNATRLVARKTKSEYYRRDVFGVSSHPPALLPLANLRCGEIKYCRADSSKGNYRPEIGNRKLQIETIPNQEYRSRRRA